MSSIDSSGSITGSVPAILLQFVPIFRATRGWSWQAANRTATTYTIVNRHCGQQSKNRNKQWHECNKNFARHLAPSGSATACPDQHRVAWQIGTGCKHNCYYLYTTLVNRHCGQRSKFKSKQWPECNRNSNCGPGVAEFCIRWGARIESSRALKRASINEQKTAGKYGRHTSFSAHQPELAVLSFWPSVEPN